ncbi:hypothetical protein VTO73DRAFT_6850 [Trametes versicolor]
MILKALKKDLLELGKVREKETVPHLLQEIEVLEKELKNRAGDAREKSPEERGEEAALTEQIRSLKEKRYKQQQERGRAKHRIAGESPTKYWSGLHREKAPRELIPAFERIGERSVAGEKMYETDPKKMAEMAREHFDGIQVDGPEISRPEQRERDIAEALENVKVRVEQEDKASLAEEVSEEDVELALRMAKTGTAPGLDGLQYEVWKTLHARYVEDSRHPSRASGAVNVVKLLAAAFVDIQRHGVCAETGFAEGWMSPIYKEKGELTKVVNYRPIMLLNADYKLLTKVMAIRLAAVAPVMHSSLP